MATKAPVVDDAALEALRPNFRGDLLRPGDRAYNDARKVFNGMFASKRPALIARCTGTADVIAALAFARGRPELPLSIRGGGHSVAGFSTNTGGIVIDLTRMRGVHVDPVRGTARAQGGCTWGDYDRETHVYGLASPGGLVSTTGIAGLTLGGGFGLLSFKHGLACDNLIGADVVSADGQTIPVTEDSNADLLWGLRGGGGNFGIVTSLEYKLHPVTDVLMAMFMFPVEQAGEVMSFYRDFVGQAPSDLASFFAFLTVPPEPPMPIFPPEILGKRVCAVIGGWPGSAEEGEKAIAPIRAFSKPLFELAMPLPYPFAQSIQDDDAPWGSHAYWKTAYMAECPDEVLRILDERGSTAPSPMTQVILGKFGGAIANVSEDSSSFPLRDAGWLVQLDSTWTDKAMSKDEIAWSKSLYAQVEPYALDRAYVNFFGDEGAARVEKAYGKDRYEKLVALKDRYDPGNVFKLNQNIKPSTER